MSPKSVSESLVQMTQAMLPGDANYIGKVFGGTILGLIDLAAYASAAKFAGNICVTASIDRVDFLTPIEVGELVTLIARVSFVGRTSLEVTIDVHAENIYTGTNRHTNRARVTMVAIKDNRPTEVPRLLCETREEKLLFLEGRLRKELRGRRTEFLEETIQHFRDSDDASLEHFMHQEKLTNEAFELIRQP